VHTALRATSLTVQGFLQAGIIADPSLGPFFDPVLGGTMQVSLNTPQEMAANGVEGVSVWLYRVERDEQRLNAPPVRVSPTQLAPTPLPLRLHYLVTPVVAVDPAFPLTSPSREQELLGKVLQLCYEHPVLRGSDLLDALAGSAGELTMRLESMALEDVARVWNALQRPYQLSVSYEVSVAAIAPQAQPSLVSPVHVPAPEYGVIVGGDSS
jgi:hypothetical protein